MRGSRLHIYEDVVSHNLSMMSLNRKRGSAKGKERPNEKTLDDWYNACALFRSDAYKHMTCEICLYLVK